ncbi:MAG: alpha/beta hydrolase [Burkholderiaceae bacterium]
MTLQTAAFTAFKDRLHPGIAELVRQAEAAAAAGPPAHLQSPAQVRASFVAGKKPLVRPASGPHSGLRIDDSQLPRTGAAPIALRLYRPATAAPTGVIAYFHGGGFTNGDLDSHDAVACALAAGSGCAVASVDYRVLPEHVFPAAFDDAVAVLRWLPVWAASLGVEAGALAAGGDSSGANLALAAALALRGEVALRALWLAYPIIGVDFDTPSYRENAEAPLLTRARCERILNDYCGGVLRRDDARVAPLVAAELDGLPPAVAIAAELDPLRSDAEILVQRLAPSAPDTVLLLAAGMPHGFLRWIGSSAACAAVAEQSFSALRRLMSSPRR